MSMEDISWILLAIAILLLILAKTLTDKCKQKEMCETCKSKELCKQLHQRRQCKK